ncbi:GIN domain-containing protein [Colwellia piezophila]|uniref:GIN domain-containing protein n=1 Tax=Colwellia piezophila TaxID=211668 RepID=UPI0003755482|nr:DUF2807 domain-containing protein [Colwellia piezophila]
MKLFIKALLLSLALLQTACSVFESQTESREVARFTALAVSGLAEVIITQGEQQALLVKVSGMPISDVVTTVENETLLITTKGFHRGESVQVFVNYNQLYSISTSGSAELTGTNTLNTKEMLITTNGAGDIKSLAIKADTLTVSINGAGNANLDVDVESIDIEMNDAGDLKVQGIAKRQNIRSNGSHGTLTNADLTYSK